MGEIIFEVKEAKDRHCNICHKKASREIRFGTKYSESDSYTQVLEMCDECAEKLVRMLQAPVSENREMNRFFYEVSSSDGTHEPDIHILGNVYYNDADGTKTCYRCAEWIGVSLPVSAVTHMLKQDTFHEYLYETVSSEGSFTQKEAEHMISTYYNGHPGTELDIRDVCDTTPVGEYWFDKPI